MTAGLDWRGRWTAWIAGLVTLVMLFVGTLVFRSGVSADDVLVAVAAHRDITVTLVEAGVLRPAESITYRSPLIGREAEITHLAREGTLVSAGDTLVQLDTTELTRELERTIDRSRQADVGVVVAEAERQDALAELESIIRGSRALDIEEAQAQLQLAEKQATRLRAEYVGLEPLLARGFITREELDRTALELERADLELGVLRKRVALLSGSEHAREEQRARLLLTQREAQLVNSRQQVADIARTLASLHGAIEASTIRARHGGLVVLEENLSASPRRKVRVGDRVTASLGLVTIPEVDRMLLETSVRESDLWRVSVGQPAEVTLDAYPDRRLDGVVETIGMLGRSTTDRPFDEKRFELTVAITTDTRDLRPDLTARARIVVARRPSAIAVPNAALSRDGDTWVVTVVRGSRASIRPVSVGESDGAYVEILEGLDVGERVSLTGSEASGAGD